MDAFLNRLVVGTEFLLSLLSRLAKRRPEAPPRNRWFDALQITVVLATLALAAGVFLVDTVQNSEGDRAFFWRFGGLSNNARTSQVFVGGQRGVIVGVAGDIVVWRDGRAGVRPAGSDTVYFGPVPSAGARYRALLPGAVRAQVLGALGLTATAADRNNAQVAGSLAERDEAEWERLSATVLVQYEPDNASALRASQRRELGTFVPRDWVCVVLAGQPRLVRVGQLQGLLAEVFHGR
ncbi:MAG: hypothetical protein WCG80_02015 [Spirochaetales bacterium]